MHMDQSLVGTHLIKGVGEIQCDIGLAVARGRYPPVTVGNVQIIDEAGRMSERVDTIRCPSTDEASSSVLDAPCFIVEIDHRVGGRTVAFAAEGAEWKASFVQLLHLPREREKRDVHWSALTLYQPTFV